MSDYISKSEVLNILYKTFEEYNMTTDKQDKHGGFGAEVFKRVKEQPTLDEEEIIRKTFYRVVRQLNEQMPIKFNGFGKTLITVEDVIKILKEECGISE